MFQISCFPFLLIAGTVAALVLTVTDAKPPTSATSPALVKGVSPCPKLFQYDSVNEPGVWTGNLIFRSPHELHGVWIRLTFDSRPKEITAEGFEVVLIDDIPEALIKNRNHLLKAGSTTNIKITIKYDGDKFPSLIGYRLNAKTVCAVAGKDDGQFFEGDTKSKDYFSTILSSATQALKPTWQCGKKSDSIPSWLAAVSLKRGDNELYICEATLISPSHVVLPAHCVTYKNDVDSIPGGLLSVTIESNKEKFGVENVIVHRGYNPQILDNDIAILQLDAAVKTTDVIMPVCLTDNIEVENTSILTGKVIGTDVKVDGEVDFAVILGIKAKECADSEPKLAGLLGDNNFCVVHSPGETENLGTSGNNIIELGSPSYLKGLVTLRYTEKENNSLDATLVAIDVTKYYKWILRNIF